MKVMKKLLSILSVLTIISPVFAEGETPASFTRTLPTGFTLGTYGDTYTSNAASASYVNGAYDAMDYLKQDKLSSANGGNVTQTAGAFVTAITATNGAVAITRGDITIPVGSYASPTSRANIWVE